MKLKLLVVLTLALMSLALFGQDLTETEANNTPGTATIIGQGLFTATVAGDVSAADVDYWRFWTINGDQLHVTISTGAAAVLTLYHTEADAVSDTPLAVANNPLSGPGLTIDFTSDQTADYYFRVSAGSAVNYTVTITNDTNATLPVELTSFNAAFSQVTDEVNISWISATETGLSGYNIMRATGDQESIRLNATLIAATNTSTEHRYSYSDNEVEPGNTYRYWLQSIDLDGTLTLHGPVNVEVTEEGNQGETPEITISAGLHGNFPNPFKTGASTKIMFRLEQPTTAKVVVYNLLGKVVRSYTRNVSSEADQSIDFDGRDMNGNKLASGIYFYRLQAGNVSQIKKMIIMK